MMTEDVLVHGKVPQSEAQIKETLDIYKEQLANEAEKLKAKEVEEIKKEAEISMMEKYKDEIQALKQQIDEANEALQKQAEEAKLRELSIEQLEEYKKNHESKLSEISNILKLDENSNLELELKNQTEKDILEGLSSSMLPDIKRIGIGSFKNSDASLKLFFEKSFPQNLQLLCLNLSYLQLVNVKHYLEPLLSCIKRVSKEVYLYWFEMDQDELSQIVKAARNTQRLILDYTVIHKSGTIDFGQNLSYSTQLIGFQNTGWSGYSNWKTNRNQFDSIVQAIKSSDLNNSLQTLNLRYCDITRSSVNLPNITIDDSKCLSPSSS